MSPQPPDPHIDTAPGAPPAANTAQSNVPAPLDGASPIAPAPQSSSGSVPAHNAADVRADNKPLPPRKRLALVAAVAIVALASLAIEHHKGWFGAGLAIDPKTVMNLLAPLLLTAGFIERAVEIIISPWRDGGASILQDRVDRLQKQIAEADPTVARELSNSLGVAQQQFYYYKGTTQRYAFCASIIMSFAAAVVGVTALGRFLPSPPTIGGDQLTWFKVYDVGLSACLLAGGADGLHSVINLFTTFFNTTTQRTQDARNADSK